MDEAYELFVECRRVLRPAGILRINVPDADLRTYADPEPVAFDARTGNSSKLGWNHPDVHKTRWNVYSLSLLLELANFRVEPLVYCNRDGKLFHQWPESGHPAYPQNSDWDMICTDLYIKRKPSLIVDAIRDD